MNLGIYWVIDVTILTVAIGLNSGVVHLHEIIVKKIKLISMHRVNIFKKQLLINKYLPTGSHLLCTFARPHSQA